ncbi:hypothetical protein [Tychonema bourrellyi]|nr:hypothetical protein [Tychonema bourrellyi]
MNYISSLVPLSWSMTKAVIEETGILSENWVESPVTSTTLTHIAL